MRPIKFRAWDKKKKEWYKPVFEAYRGELWELMVSFGGDLSARTLDEAGRERTEHQSLWPDKYELMQFTGLLDKNGKEIYEGDIIDGHKHEVLLRNWWSIYRCRCGARRGVDLDGSPMGPWRGGEPQRFVSEVVFQNGTFTPCATIVKDSSVIGNIYENPELLK